MDLEPWLPQLTGLAGIAIGAMVTWFMCRNKSQALRARSEERAKNAQKSIADLEAGCASLEADMRQLRHSEAVALRRQSELEILAQSQQRGLAEKQQLLRDAEHRIAQNFRALSVETLRATQQEFLHYAQATFDTQQKEATSELEQRRVAVETLVRPVAATLDKVESRIVDLERARRETETALGEQVRQMAHAQQHLQRETAQLTKALRQPSGRGRWGELQLQRVVELSGMQNYCDFSAPVDQGSDLAERPLQPSLVVKLPSKRIIAVDAHTSLDSYLAAIEAPDQETQEHEMKLHADTVARRLKDLSSPDYAAQLGQKPEFTVLFLPGEGFLTAALGEEPDLLERGIQQGIILATPSTLIALLRSAAVGWHQEGIAEQARTVSAAGKELHGQVRELTHQVIKIGESLGGTVRHYNAALGTLERKVLPGARNLGRAKVSSQSPELPSVAGAKVTQQVQAPEEG